MISQLSDKGIWVGIETFYQPNQSNPLENEFMFAYRIVIENHNLFPVKLLRRRWLIFDSNCQIREVKGTGVVGNQPIIHPKESYKYFSGCNLQTDLGKMQGEYEMINILSKEKFLVPIPAFTLVAPFKYN